MSDEKKPSAIDAYFDYWKQFEEDIDEEDGTVIGDGLCVHTDYCRLENLYIDWSRGYLGVEGDNRAVNVEIRIPLEVLVKNGWTLPPRPEQEGSDENGQET
jgi:hypothetical protein